MATKVKADVPKISKADVERYRELDEQRLSKNREVQSIEREQKEIAGRLMANVAAHGGKERRLRKFGYVLALIAKRCSVSWKGEFVRVAGAEEAERIAAEQPEKDVLTINAA